MASSAGVKKRMSGAIPMRASTTPAVTGSHRSDCSEDIEAGKSGVRCAGVSAGCGSLFAPK